MEDDDWYSPHHVADIVRRLETHDAVGCSIQRYYNVAVRKWAMMQNKGSSLCQTGFRYDLLPLFVECVATCWRGDRKGIDAEFWRRLHWQSNGRVQCFDDRLDVVGIKGMPGRKGIGVGHDPTWGGWTDDPDMTKLVEWIGEDAEVYREMQFDGAPQT